MTITNRVQGAFFDSDSDADDVRLIRLAPNAPPSKGPTRRQGRPWTNEEHDRFLHAMEIFPSGPWKDIAAHVGTRTTRQTMTHAQKYRQKIARWKRGATIKPAASASLASPSTATASIIKTQQQSTRPSSPQAADDVDLVKDDAHEEAMFWKVLQDILEESDDKQFEESMVSLLHESQPMQFVTPAPDAFSVRAPLDYYGYAYCVDPDYQELGALV